jgi:hypothetical protein
MFCYNVSNAQNKPNKENNNLNEDYSNFKIRNEPRIKFKFFEAPPLKNSIVVIDDKIYKSDSEYFKNISKSSLRLITAIKDTTSNSGVKYIYIYKTK